MGDSVQTRRKTPEDFLSEAQAEDRAAKGGYLKIFLGYASGVGKTFRMLDEARRRRARGQDVVIGAVQPRVTPEIQALLQCLQVICLKDVPGGSVIDLDALLRRAPEVCFIDGLAYDNPPGSPNPTRWQDARQLVEAGIKVVASINIQFIAELQEQVEAITGKHVTQTVPISFIRSADEIEIVDAPALEAYARSPGEHPGDETQQRQLLRLREMVLVLAADVVDHQLTNYLDAHGVSQHFGTQERILVCLTADSSAREMIETAQTIARRFYGELLAVNVDQPEISSVERAALEEKLSWAREAGVRVEILHGRDPIDTLLEFARARGITQIFIGHSRTSRWWSRLFGSKLDRLVRLSRGMDVRIFPNSR
jgi:two-component system sensor histidine kinase KdpD